MRQAFVPEVGSVVFREVDVPEPAPGEVLLRVARIGICGSDVHVFHGEHPIVQPPLVQGHEFSGWVERCGEGVTGLALGDLVTVEPAIGCGSCAKCRSGLIAQCASLDFIGGNRIGAGADFFSVDARQVVRMKPTTSPDDAAMTEPVACAVHAGGRGGELQDRNVFVAGGGPIGNLTAQLARLRGARRVLLSDMLGSRRAIAEACGFEALDPGAQHPIVEQLRDRLGGEEVHVAFECVGAEAALGDCIGVVERGGTVVIVGVYPAPPRADMIAVQDRELELRGSLMYTWTDFIEAARLIDERRVNLPQLQTHHLPFDRWAEGYRLLADASAGALKVLVDVNEESALGRATVARPGHEQPNAETGAAGSRGGVSRA
jgi:L-iditol 2-dehydrogenase